MDFITNLPLSNNKTIIWIVVDRLTKFAHFIALPTTVTATSLAQTFLNEIDRLHGTPKTIVSDRDRVFINKLWREIFKQIGTNLAFSSSYHPQTDGKTEVLNRCLETYLRCFASEHAKQWTKFLPLAEFCYNTSIHSAIGMFPFEALYGCSPPTISNYIPGNSDVHNLDDLLVHRHKILKQLRENLLTACNRMIQQANKKRKENALRRTFGCNSNYNHIGSYHSRIVSHKSQPSASMDHFVFSNVLAPLHMNWNFPLLLIYTQFFMCHYSKLVMDSLKCRFIPYHCNCKRGYAGFGQ